MEEMITAREAAERLGVSRQWVLRLCTKADLKAEIAELKAEIQAMLNRQLQTMLGVMVALTAIYAAIVKLL